MAQWFCLNCKRFVDAYIDIFKGFSLSCKDCGSTRLMKMEKTDDERFKNLVKEFKDKTGVVE